MSTIMYKDIEYGGSGGGGTEVIPNPAGQPLADLNKLQINNDIYRIPSGGSGSDVSITPTLVTGTKIADFEIDGVEGELYAPAGGSDVSITPSLAAGVKIADFEIDSVEGELFVPDSSKIYVRYTKPADSLGENGDLAVIISPDFTYELIDEMGGWELDSYSINNDGSYNFTFTGLTDTSAADDNSVVVKINGFGNTGTYNVKCRIKFEGNMGGVWNQALGPALFASPAQSANGYNISQAQAGTFIRIGGDDGGIINIDWDQDWHSYDYNFDYHSSNNNLYIRLATARNFIYNQTDPATMYVENFLISGDTSTVPKVSEAYSKVNGHWIEVELGGGASAVSDLTDVQFTNLSDGQILKYDSTSQKWINVAEDTDYANLTNKPSINSITLSGNKTSSDLGIVVTLTQAQYDALTTEEKNDPNKVYYVTDAPSGGGVTELSELNDVNVNSITDGQVLKYDATNHVWVNDDESGGTTVVANPSGSATADLNKVQIGETIYNIAGSGGSGGGITALDTTERTTWNTLFTLSDTITNYDAILVNMYYTNGQGYPMTGSIVLPIAELADHSYRTWIDGGNNDRALEIEFTDSTHYQIIAGNSYNGIHGVYGLKFGGGSSGGGGITTETTELFNSTISTTGTYTLDDDYENYDFLTIIGGVQSDEQYACKEVRCYSVAGLKEYFDANSNNNILFTGYAYRYFRFRIDNNVLTIQDYGDGQGLYTIYGHKFTGGGGGQSAEIIPITAGDGTTSRTFTFSKTPKFIKADWISQSPWRFTASFTWGADRIFHIANDSAPATSTYTGASVITYGADGKSFTITSFNANGAMNGTDAAGFMYVDYGEGGSGGGTTVIANPTGTPTDQLDTVQIGDTIYEVAGGGSGGGSTVNECIFQNSGTSNPNIITLDNAYTNYDILIFRNIRVADSKNYKIDTSFECKNLVTNDYLQGLGWYSSNYWSYQISNDTTLTRINQGNDWYISEIYGFKVGSGGTESGYSETVLFTGSGSESTYALSDSIQNYDLIEVQIKYSQLGDYRVPTVFPVSDFTTGITYRATADDWYVGFVYTDDTTFTNADSRNAYITEIKGIKVGGSGGGGTEVVPNPQETPTDTLETIKIGDIVYDIAGTGGGSIFSESTLWTNPDGTATGTFTLSDNIDNYDAIALYYGLWSEYGQGTLNITDYRIITVDDLNEMYNNGTKLLLTGYYTRTTYVSAHEDEIVVSVSEGSQILLAVKGIKFGGNPNNNENGIFSKSVIQSQNILSEFEYKNAKIPSYAQNICVYPIAEHAIEEGFIPATDVLNNNTSLTIYAVVKSLVSDNNYHSLIACSYASSNGNAPNIYSYGGRLYTSVYSSDTSTNVNSTVYHVLSIAVDNSTKKVRYYIDGVAYHGEKSFNNSGRYPSFGGTLVSTTGLIDSSPCDLIYGAVVSGAESAEDIIANHNLLMTEYSEYIGH